MEKFPRREESPHDPLELLRDTLALRISHLRLKVKEGDFDQEQSSKKLTEIHDRLQDVREMHEMELFERMLDRIEAIVDSKGK